MANLMMSVPAEAEHHFGLADPATIAGKIHQELTRLERSPSDGCAPVKPARSRWCKSITMKE